MKSKKELLEDMVFLSPIGFDSVRVDDETYGKRSFMYLWTGEGARDWWSEQLALLGHVIDKAWTRQNKGVAVRVRYFRGWHWDE